MQTLNRSNIAPVFVTLNIYNSLKKTLTRVKKIGRAAETSSIYYWRSVERLNQVLPKLKPVDKAITPVNRNIARGIVYELPKAKKTRIRHELINAGATLYGILKSESRYLPKVLHDNEKINAVIYGQHNASSVMIVATDERIVVLDKKPIAVRFDEVSYEVVSGIGFKVGMIYATVVLHTAIANFEMKFVNLRCAEKFVKHIEVERLKRELTEVPGDLQQHEAEKKIPVNKKYVELMDKLAGYYLLPLDEDEREKIMTEVS